jgi:hypothetical protein
MQARSYDEATQNSVLGWYLRNAQTRALSHPLPVMRAREVDRWAQGSQYKSLLARNRAYGSSAGNMGSVSSSNGKSSNGSSSGGSNGQLQQPSGSITAAANGAREIKIM